jgi:hypothetical protein
MSRPYHIGCYYFPNYHVDPRNEVAHGEGWTEWELVRRAEPRFPGHRQPRLPLWGYEDEADPQVMARKIDAAADHGVSTFIFDWYMYEDGPFLNRCLDEGYLKAPNCERLSFSLMWANHDWINIHPAKAFPPDQYWQRTREGLLYPGKVGPEAFERIADDLVARYFTHPWYWKLDGAPYFSLYDLARFIGGLGGLRQAREAVDSLRAKARTAGLAGVHLNAVVWGQTILPGETAPADPRRVVEALGCDSVTSYVWIHHVALPHFPFTDFELVRDGYFAYWDRARDAYGVPYFPNASVGWDASPRTVQSDRYRNLGYPFGPMIQGNTPEAFAEALQMIRERLERQASPNVLTVNSWNEWTEGSYLEPDTEYGMAYLEAIRNVFGK